MSHRDTLANWLRDAHAMEQQAVEILEKQERRLEHYPEMQAKVREHAALSRRQAERVQACLQRMGEDTSAVKSGMSQLVGNMQAMMNAMSGDEVVKDAIADYAFERFEIASYRSLISAAELAGDAETRLVCEEILREEEDMAAWIARHLPSVTRSFMERQAGAAPKAAKR